MPCTYYNNQILEQYEDNGLMVGCVCVKTVESVKKCTLQNTLMWSNVTSQCTDANCALILTHFPTCVTKLPSV